MARAIPSNPSVPPLVIDRTARRILLASLLLLLVAAVPWLARPILASTGVDAAWIAALHHGFAQHWRWGHDIVWHYGPLGFLFGGFYHPQTYTWLLTLNVMLLTIYWLGMRQLWSAARFNPAVPMAAALLIVMTNDVLFLSFPLLLMLVYGLNPRAERSPVFWLLFAATGLIAWVKFSYLLLGLSSVIIIDSHRMFTRRMPILLLPYLALLALFWQLLGQQFGDLPPYLHAAWELARGFPEIATNVHPAYFALLFFAVAASWIFLLAHTLHRTGNKPAAWVLGAGLLLQLALVIKAEFLNDNDYHLMQSLAWLFLLALLSKDYFWQSRTTRATYPLMISTCLAAVFMLPGYMRSSGGELKGWANVAKQLAAPSKTTTTTHVPQHPQAQAGSTDVYTASLMTLLAQSQANYRPRPVLQSYHVYTPYLARLNRDALLGANAPQHIWFAPEPLIGHYPSIEDGLSWPELLTQYDLREMRGGYALLDKAAKPRRYRMTLLGENRIVRFDETLQIPAAKNALVWAKLTYRPSIIGKLFSLVYRLPPSSMQVTPNNGAPATYRIMPEVMQEGFLLSPLVENAADFAALSSPALASLIARKHITTLQFSRPNDGWCGGCMFEDQLELQFYKLELTP